MIEGWLCIYWEIDFFQFLLSHLFITTKNNKLKFSHILAILFLDALTSVEVQWICMQTKDKEGESVNAIFKTTFALTNLKPFSFGFLKF